MELFLLEHKKLWRRRSTKISVLLCFIYVVTIGSVLSFQWFIFGSWSSDEYISAFGNNFDGYEMIRNEQDYSLTFGGELTDESLQQLVRDYQEISAAGIDRELQKTDRYIVNSWLNALYPELQNGEMYYKTMISYVAPENLIDFYERRQNVIEDFLENNGQTGTEKDYLLQLNSQVKEPFRYEWTEGWSNLLGSMVPELNVVMALFLAIVLSALFAGEWHDNTSPLILTAKNGWRKIALAKVFTGLAFTVELFAMIAAGQIAAQLFFLGTTGWDMPIQLIKLIAIAPMNMLQAEIYEYAFILLGGVGYAGIVMLISAAVKSSVPALILSLAVVYVPSMIDQYLPFGLQKALDFIPLVGSGTDIFRTNTFHIFGKYVWSPYLLIAVPVLIGIACMPFAVKKWSRRIRV